MLFRTVEKGNVVENEDTMVEDDNNVKYRLLEKKFKAISKKTEALEVEKRTTGFFLASMSHKIRTPPKWDYRTHRYFRWHLIGSRAKRIRFHD